MELSEKFYNYIFKRALFAESSKLVINTDAPVAEVDLGLLQHPR